MSAYVYRPRRRMPPFLCRYANRLRDASATAWIAIGPDSWQWAWTRERSHIVIVCPPTEDPAGFDWTALAGHDPVLLHRTCKADGSQVRTLVEALIRDGVERILDDQSACLYVVKGVPHDV